MAKRAAILRPDDGELMGYVSMENGSWAALTIFGHVIARAETQAAASDVVHTDGLAYLQGVWRYYDESERDWFPCVLKEVYENKVVVTRTNEMGFENPGQFKRVVIKHPTETSLQKA